MIAKRTSLVHGVTSLQGKRSLSTSEELVMYRKVPFSHNITFGQLYTLPRFKVSQYVLSGGEEAFGH